MDHIISRVVDRRMVLDHNEKERFRNLMRKTEAFSGVQILTHVILDTGWKAVHAQCRKLLYAAGLQTGLSETG